MYNPDGLAIDWEGRNLYWCDKSTDTIEVSRLDGKSRRVLVRTGLHEPRAIVVHPYRGWLFYSDWSQHAHIGRIGMDGTITEPRHIITKNLGWPNGLTIDYVTDHIYWSDARLDYIAMANLDGSGWKYIVQEDLPHTFSLSVFEDFLYWTDWEHKSVVRAHKYSGNMRTNLTHTIHRPMGLQIFHPYRQNGVAPDWENPCIDNGGCVDGALCLIKPPNALKRMCACPEHHYSTPGR